MVEEKEIRARVKICREVPLCVFEFDRFLSQPIETWIVFDIVVAKQHIVLLDVHMQTTLRIERLPALFTFKLHHLD